MRRFVSLFLVFLILLPQSVAWSRPDPQSAAADAQVEALLARMGSADRVGQLFLVTYYGSDVSETSDVATLISHYRVGGVILSAENDNFDDTGVLATQVYGLTTSLQTLATKQPSSTEIPYPGSLASPYIPLFIGVEQNDEDWLKMPQQYSGLTPLPSSMAIGATWDPALAESVGRVVGQELPALGINLLLGPSADVVETPKPFTSGDLGTQVFGGESFWVSRMTSAYIRGVHEGSNGQLAIMPRYFPGHGGADRLASVEVPTVRRSLAQLKQFDLIPFFTVTDTTKDPLSVADGLMTGHISYLGFQGDNPRVATNPISLDNLALQELMKLEPVATWRQNGGLIVSDALGLRGVRLLYDRQGQSFPGRRIAYDALTAGNDMLYLGSFGTDPIVHQKDAIVDTIEYFVQTYDSDPAFQTRVDEAVRRILHKKIELYGERFDLEESVLPPLSGLDALGLQTNATSNVAQSALTRLSGLSTSKPQAGESIVVFTDTRSVKRCTTCISRPMIAVDALQSAILRLYGPTASKLITPSSIQSFSFEQLANYLEFGPQQVITAEGATPVPDNLNLALDSADWVVFVMQDVDPSVPSSYAVKQFLAVPPVDTGTRIVVMAMDAPYYLDSTEVGKLTAYYGLYDYTDKFVDVAARALFLGVSFTGASPVSVPGVNYNILEATSPDPDQIIKLVYNQGSIEGSGTPTPASVLKKGDVLQLSTGDILDQNARPVPDGTPVEFVFEYASEGLRSSISATTLSGKAQAISLPLDRPGELKITVVSGLATQSDTLSIIVYDTGEISIEVSSPDIRPTETPSPTITPTPLPITPTEEPPNPPKSIVGFGDWLLSLFGLTGIGLTVFVLGLSRRNLNYGLLVSLPAFILGLSGYSYYALYLPGADLWRNLIGDTWGAGVITWLSALVGLGLTFVVIFTSERWPRTPLVRHRR